MTPPPDVANTISSFFEEPLKPDVKGEMHDIRRSSLHLDEAMALADLVLDLAPAVTLEIGMAEAGSCVAIAAARRHLKSKTSHLVLDPFQESLTCGAGLKELARLELRDSIEWRAEYSEAFLNEAPSRRFVADFVFIDGGHSIGQKVTDAFLMNKVLSPGGVVAFHDALLFSTSVAVTYLVKECGYRVTLLGTDEKLRRLLRCLRYWPKLSPWYARVVMPSLCRSLVALQKPA